MIGNKERAYFIESCEDIAYYVRIKSEPPVEVQDLYYKRLKNYRLYLDRIDYKMPKQKFYYNAEDQRTWKYLHDGQLNPNWVHKC